MKKLLVSLALTCTILISCAGLKTRTPIKSVPVGRVVQRLNIADSDIVKHQLMIVKQTQNYNHIVMTKILLCEDIGDMDVSGELHVREYGVNDYELCNQDGECRHICTKEEYERAIEEARKHVTEKDI